MTGRSAAIGGGLLAAILVGALFANIGHHDPRPTAAHVEGFRARDVVPAPLPSITPKTALDRGASLENDGCISSYGSHPVGRDSAGRVVVSLDINLKSNPATVADLATILDSHACRDVIPRIVRNLHHDMAVLGDRQVLRVSYRTARGARIVIP